MTAKLYIYRGLQGSGKSTLANTLASLDGGRVVGRDKIRSLLGFSGIGRGHQEQEVTMIQGRLIAKGLQSGQNVHVDDMNLKDVYVRRLMAVGEACNAKVEIIDLTNVPLAVCIERDKSRPSPVGETVLRSYHTKFVHGRQYPLPIPTTSAKDMRLQPPELYVPDLNKPEALIVDMDGTTAIKWEGRGYHDYDERVFRDTPNIPVIRMVKAMADTGVQPVFLSGRKGFDTCRTATSAWITEHIGIGAHWLYMREPDDNRPDWIVKTELFDDFIRPNWNVVAAVDDRNQVVQRWRQMGIPTFQVADGDF